VSKLFDDDQQAVAFVEVAAAALRLKGFHTHSFEVFMGALGPVESDRATRI
jgi:hypothetical protein